MSAITTTPYINFQGRAREAMERYRELLGGTLQLLAQGADGVPHPAAPDERIMHAYLLSDGAAIMGTDGLPDYPPATGDNMAVVLSGSDATRLTKIFKGLGDGGRVKQDLKQESWGTFGWLEDKFGVNWMVNITPADETPAAQAA